MNTHDSELPTTYVVQEILKSVTGEGISYATAIAVQTLMRKHGEAAIEADRQARGDPVCFASINKQGDVTRTSKKRDGWAKTPLYSAPQPQQIPEGYKLVPIEPTEDMLEAGLKALFNGGGIYRAMLEAAPEPEEKS